MKKAELKNLLERISTIIDSTTLSAPRKEVAFQIIVEGSLRNEGLDTN